MAGRLLIVALGALVLLIVSAAIFGLMSATGENGVASFDDLREQGVMFLEDEHVFLVFNDGEPLALSDDPQHLPGEHTEWCESSGLFETPSHGEKFDARGYYYAGPAQRGLARYPVRVEGDAIHVELDEEIAGPERGEGGDITPRGPFCVPG